MGNHPNKTDLESSREELAIKYWPKVFIMAKRFKATRGLKLVLEEDLVSAGTLGMLGGIDRWDRFRPLNTYLEVRITGAMIDYLRSLDSYPEGYRQEMNRQQREFEAGGPAPEIVPIQVVSVERVAGNRGGDSSNDQDKLPPDSKPGPEESLSFSRMVCSLRTAIRSLPPTPTLRGSGEVIDRVYLQDQSLEEVAAALGMTREEARTRQRDGLKRLRKHLPFLALFPNQGPPRFPSRAAIIRTPKSQPSKGVVTNAASQAA